MIQCTSCIDLGLICFREDQGSLDTQEFGLKRFRNMKSKWENLSVWKEFDRAFLAIKA